MKFFKSISLFIGIMLMLSSTAFAQSSDTIKNEYYQVVDGEKVKIVDAKEANIVKDKKEVNRLLNLGFTLDEIKTFSQAEYERYNGLNGKVVGKTTKYYRVTKGTMVEISEKQAMDEVKAYNAKKASETSSSSSVGILSGGSDTESCSWLTMTTTVSDMGSKQFLFKNSFQWLTSPVWTLTDVVGLTHASSISVDQDSEYLKYTVDRYTNTIPPSYLGTKDFYYWTADTKNSSGYAYKYDIMGSSSDGSEIYSNHRGYMVYSGRATPDTFVGYSNAYGHYSHQQATWPSISIDLVSGNMSVSPSWAFDEATDTDVQFYIN